MNNGEQFQYDLMPGRDFEAGDKPIRLSPTHWERMRTVARKRSCEIDSTGMVTVLNCRQLAAALRAGLAAGDFVEQLVPDVKQVVVLLGQGRGLIVQRRSAIAGSALRVESGEATKEETVKKLPDRFEKFRLDKTRSSR